MSKNWIENYQRLVRFLGQALGENHEIVLHVLVEDDSYIGEIVNSHISNRSEGAPLTNLALKKIKQEDYKVNDSMLNYKVVVKDDKVIQGSTFYIKDDDDNLLGLLCINSDFSKHKNIAKDLLSLINIDIDHFLNEGEEHTGHHEVETLSADIEEIIQEAIDPVLLDPRVTLTKDTRLDIVRTLEQKGIFQLKGAIVKVANLLKVSEPSVYRYLQEINRSESN